MGSLYRSEPMTLCQLFLQVDSAFASVAELGELGLCEFRDLNNEMSSYQRKYVVEVKRCDEMERKIRMVENELEKNEITPADAISEVPAPLPRDMNDLEAKFEKLEEEIGSINYSTGILKRNYLQLSDIRNVLVNCSVLFNEGRRSQAFQSISDAQHGYGPIVSNGHIAPPQLDGIGEKEKEAKETELKFLTGVIRFDRVPAFERVLWRMCRGNVFVRTLAIDEDENAPFKDDFKKAAFLLFFSGEQLRSKVRRICDGFRATVVEHCPEDPAERSKLLSSIHSRLQEMQTVIGKTLEHRDRVLHAAAQNIKTWDIQALKLKSVFHTLNMFNLDITQKCLIAECWIPTNDIPRVHTALRHATEVSGTNVSSILNRLDSSQTPPTYHRLNKFTRGFQNIVDSYGIASYQEVNPAPYTIITFPFLFAVMFGDSGHGTIMFLAALAMVIFEKRIEAAKVKDEIFNTFYGGRYVVLLMGAFAIYTGFIYNDIFSKSINIFGSAWKNPFNITKLENISLAAKDKKVTLDLPPEYAFLHDDGPYPFGLDPIWSLADNKLNYVNPMKMKSSIILGISQMFFGIMLSLFNHLHFKSMVDVFFVFIPQLLFLTLIFVYLCVQVIVKWIFFWVKPGTIFGFYYPGPHCAPSLLIGLINMFMIKQGEPGFIDCPDNSSSHNCPGQNYTIADQCYLRQWYPMQKYVEMGFILVAVLCIPTMLLVKPIVQWRRAKAGEHVHIHGGEEDAEFTFGDAMVYQAIHTIEFALGCISHTASYLRLWALSLAHAQLSDVLWTMVMRQSLSRPGVIGIVGNFIIFMGFAVLSIAILVLMEGLSAFLHALRLHWVEFQSKFYVGAGIQFEPFSFEHIIREHEGLEQ
jgi:V-type H+-transporting ATPase subunit a